MIVSSFLLLALAGGCSSAPADPPVQSVVQHDGVCDPSDPSDDKTAPPPGPCTDAVAGDGTTCQSYADLKDEATAACTAQGGALTEIPLADPQGCPEGQAPTVPYTCCFPAS
jgi:hypothetical protein